MKKILVTGGAGYIGSHVVRQFAESGNCTVTILDNLSTGFASTVDTLRTKYSNVEFTQADLFQWDFIADFMMKNKFDAVIHFAASLIVPESVTEPLKYYLNNTANTANLIKCCVDSGTNRFVFSSTAAVYGEPENVPQSGMSESGFLNPINPYGRSKMFSEHVLRDTAAAHPEFKFAILRYFNVAGASSDGLLGQSTLNATHLIKVAAETALGKRQKMSIFGTDYKTPDGTCVRDYIHVEDLAAAHVRALGYIETSGSDIFNCGYGHGYSVREVIEVMRRVSGVDFRVDEAPRRAGDPALLISDSSRIREKTGWKSRYDDLEYICRTALEWEKGIR